jgi:hypothetical protein
MATIRYVDHYWYRDSKKQLPFCWSINQKTWKTTGCLINAPAIFSTAVCTVVTEVTLQGCNVPCVAFVLHTQLIRAS